MVFPGADPSSVASAAAFCQTAQSMAGRTISPSTSGRDFRKQRLIQFASIGRYGQGLPPVMLNFENLKLGRLRPV